MLNISSLFKKEMLFTKTILNGILALLIMFGISSIVLASISPEQCKVSAIAAAKAIETEGDAAIAKINLENGPFVWGNGAGYVWVFDMDGILVADPNLPNHIGENISFISDLNGTMIISNMIRLIKSDGAGWVAYVQRKNWDANEPSPRVAYVTKAVWNNKTYGVASALFGWTLEDIKKQFPYDAVYEE